VTETLRKREGFENINSESVRLILKTKNEIKPWTKRMWCINEIDEEYHERMYDVLDLYEKEYEHSSSDLF
jgi:hypothetical protein